MAPSIAALILVLHIFYAHAPRRKQLVWLFGRHEADTRFAANSDDHGVGLTRFLAAAVRANAAR